MNKIINVTEPSTCNYHMIFETPYVCHKHAMLVYPTLDTDRQTEWGLLEGELARGEITKKVRSTNKQAKNTIIPTKLGQ